MTKSAFARALTYALLVSCTVLQSCSPIGVRSGGVPSAPNNSLSTSKIHTAVQVREAAIVAAIAIGPTGNADFEAARAAAHAQGRWLTAELQPGPAGISTTNIASTMRQTTATLSPDVQCLGCSLPTPKPYTLVTKTVSSSRPRWSSSELQTDAAHDTSGKFATRPSGYDIQVKYSDGTSALGTGFVSTTGVPVLVKIQPNGTAKYSRYIEDDADEDGESDDCGDGSCGDQPDGSPITDGGIYDFQPGWWCNFAVLVGGLFGEIGAEVLFPEGTVWSWKFGGVVGGGLTYLFLAWGGACP